jgi:hypothetical protein
VSACSIRFLRHLMLPAPLLFLLAGCPLWWKGDSFGHAELQAFAPARSADDATQTVDHILTSLGTEGLPGDRSGYVLNGEVVTIATEERSNGTRVCIEYLGATGTTEVAAAMADLFAKLRPAMEAEFGEEFVAAIPCSGREPYWPGGTGT